MMPEPTPWRHWLAVAAQAGFTPSEFWRLSVREWRALTAPTPDSLDRTAFDALAARYSG